MIIDISNEVFTRLKNTIKPTKIMESYSVSNSVFPCVTFEEIVNTSDIFTKDSAGEFHNQLSFEVNIFTNSQTKVTDAKKIRNKIDSIMSDEYGMNRSFSQAIPNYLDDSIYRYVLRYDSLIDKNKKIYRR